MVRVHVVRYTTWSCSPAVGLAAALEAEGTSSGSAGAVVAVAAVAAAVAGADKPVGRWAEMVRDEVNK